MNGLKVTKVRYFETRRGIGYECRTNVPGVTIWNDGDGGGTYVERCMEAKRLGLYDLTEGQLEDLICKYEDK